MDHSWMDSLRTSREYRNGVEALIEFGKKNASDKHGMIYCPCVNCLNECRMSIGDVRNHLLCDGIQTSYKTLNQWRLEDRQNHMVEAMVQTRRVCYLAPILQSVHWGLCVFLPSENHILWLCSKGWKVPSELKEQYNMVMMIYRMRSLNIRDNNAPSWSTLKVPRQRGDSECGLYVMNFMYNIIQSGEVSCQGIKNLFGDTDPLSSNDIDLVRDIIASKFFSVAIAE